MTLYLDDAVGETRLVRTDEDGRAVELRIERWSENGLVAREGERYAGRVARMEPGLGGAFVDIGLKRAGFLPFKRGRAPEGLHEGALVHVEIAAEEGRDKGPRLRRLPDGRAEDARPGRIGHASSLVERFPDAARGPEARRVADAAVELALAREIALPGGGSVAIEPTRALTSIDVDAGGRRAGSPERLARDVNAAAIDLVAPQIALRGLSGLAVMDLVDMRAAEARQEARERMALRLAEAGVRAEVGAASWFGLLPMSIERRRRPVHEVLCDREGRMTAETAALLSLRRLEDEARVDRGAQLALEVPRAIAEWLRDTAVPWRDALTARIGARFEIQARPDDRADAFEVSPLI